MDTHLCALPAGEHLPRPRLPRLQLRATQEERRPDLLGRMLSSHQAALERARLAREPAGQLAGAS
jgi:hypothetical protein